MKKLKFEEMRPEELEQARAEAPVVYLPCGIHEWHSYHLPVGLDFLKAHDLCLRAAQRTGGVVLPPYYLGTGGLSFPWTLSIDAQLSHQVFVAFFGQLAAAGYQVIAAVTGHYPIPQVLTIKRAAAEAMQAHPVRILALPEYELTVDTDYQMEHAGKWETSLLWAARPELVDMSRLSPDSAQWPLGVFGPDPRPSASQALGEEMAELIADRLADQVRALLAGAEPDNLGLYRRWAEQIYRVPLTLTPDSLHNTGEGFAFAITNRELRSRYLSGLRGLRVDGVAVPHEGAALFHHEQKRTVAARDLHDLNGFFIRMRESATVSVPGPRLSPGPHTVELSLEVGGVVEMVVRGEETVAH